MDPTSAAVTVVVVMVVVMVVVVMVVVMVVVVMVVGTDALLGNRYGLAHSALCVSTF
jgi:hypothetical protein